MFGQFARKKNLTRIVVKNYLQSVFSVKKEIMNNIWFLWILRPVDTVKALVSYHPGKFEKVVITRAYQNDRMVKK